jgi:hypothetical protein
MGRYQMNNHSYVNIERRFQAISEEALNERNEREIDFSFGEHTGFTWDKLLESKRVVILAEAGSGKTTELKEQVKKLNREGKPAFFIAIEQLANENLSDILARESGLFISFENWLDANDGQAWFFLDAVDELKLNQGKLDLALSKIAGALGSKLARAHIILTCRPSDWRPETDWRIFCERLPVVEEATIIAPITSEEAFLEPLRNRQLRSTSAKEKSDIPATRIVALQSLSEKQIQQFAANRGLAYPKAFVAQLRRDDVLMFARRPLDLERMLNIWKDAGKFGTLLEQHEADIIAGLADKPDRPDDEALSAAEARAGAETLALAIALCGARTIAIPEQTVTANYTAGALDVSAILPDWTPAKINALLRRGIFDPATYGRVRFHHRSVQEYLAACKIRALVATGLPARKVAKLFFAQTYEERVVIPSMRPIAAWYALWDNQIRVEILKREPEVLLLHGDPSSLPLEDRASYVSSYVDKYREGQQRGLRVPNAEVRRVARPDLAQVVKNCWAKDISNDEISEFLLQLIWNGAIQECAEIAFEAAMNIKLDDYHRILAVRALSACDRPDLMNSVVVHLLANQNHWPDRTIFGIIDDIFPQNLNIFQFETLIKRTPEPSHSISSFGYQLYYLAKGTPADARWKSDLAKSLRKLILEGHVPDPSSYQPQSKFGHLGPALTVLCLQALEKGNFNSDVSAAAVTASRFASHNIIGREEHDALNLALSSQDDWRRSIFAEAVKLSLALTPAEVARGNYWLSHHESYAGPLQKTDFDWLLNKYLVLHADEQQIYFEAIHDLWWKSEWCKELGDQLLASLPAADLNRQRVIDELNPKPMIISKKIKQHQKSIRDRKKADLKRQTADETSWIKFLDNLQKKPEHMFGPAQATNTLYNICKWLGFSSDTSSRLTLDNWRAFEQTTLPELAQRFYAIAKNYWRSTTPPIRSERNPEDANSIFNNQTPALTSLQIESELDINWAQNLSHEEAVIAAKWSTLEMNGYPVWLDNLALCQPDAVKSVLGRELDFEFTTINTSMHPHVLGMLGHQGTNLSSLFVSEFVDKLLQWPAPPIAELEHNSYIVNLDLVMTMLIKNAVYSDKFIKFCQNRFSDTPTATDAVQWLRGLMSADAPLAVTTLETVLDGLPDTDAVNIMTNFLGRDLDGGMSYRAGLPLPSSVKTLSKFAILSYKYVREADDIHHEGTYTPVARDDAQRARSSILGQIIETPGQDAYLELKELSALPLFADSKDYILSRARERAAKDSQLPALLAQEYTRWIKTHAWPPKNHAELFQCVLSVLSDIAFDVQNADFSDKNMLRNTQTELQLQPVLAKKILNRSMGRYQVVREPEVMNQKKPDIVILANAFNGRTAIEIKVADSWTVAQLEDALIKQLVGQYLRDVSYNSGILWLVYRRQQKHWVSAEGNKISFEEVVVHLRNKAKEIEPAHPGKAIAIEILDLR